MPAGGRMTTLDAVRRPEYTGPNRCWPCTTLNAVVIGVAAVVVGLVSVPAALAVGAVGGAALWLRGYVVPYTPRFAPRMADRLPLEFSGPSGGAAGGTPGGGAVPDGERGGLADTGPSDPEAVLETLLRAGVLVEDDAGIALSESFASAWASERATLLELSGSELADAVADAAPDEFDATAHEPDGEVWVQLGTAESALDESDVLLSRPVAVAEVGAVRALAATDAGMAQETRAAAANALRAFLDTCPVCEVALIESSTADCCGGQGKADPNPVSLCPECERPIYTFPDA